MGQLNADAPDHATRPVLSLVFAAGDRPTLEAVVRCGQSSDVGAQFSVTPHSRDGIGAQLAADGLTVDCRGLAPGQPEPLPPHGVRVELATWPNGQAVSLDPTPHLTGPVLGLAALRELAKLATRLASLPGALAVIWEPADCWIGPARFAADIADWAAGGTLPIPGLVRIRREASGARYSKGLVVLIGQEVRIEPMSELTAEAGAAVATDVVARLIDEGPIREESDIVLADGKELLAVPVRGGSMVSLMLRRTAAR